MQIKAMVSIRCAKKNARQLAEFGFEVAGLEEFNVVDENFEVETLEGKLLK